MALDVEQAGDDRGVAARAAERQQAPAASWQRLFYRGSQAVAAATGGLTLVLAYRYWTRHRSLEPATTGPELVAILLALLGCVLATSVLVFRPARGEVRRLRRTAATWSVALLLTLVAVGHLINLAAPDGVEVGTPLLSQAAVDAYLAAHLPDVSAQRAVTYRIPTGVLVQSFEFLNANNVQVAGYVWQKYPASLPADVSRGFVLPEAVADAYSAEEVYRFAADGAEVIGWYFDASLRQSFDYHRYPFDRQDVWLRLWHRDFDRDVVLVPDLASYRDLDPTTLPGLEEQFVYGGWQPEYAAFSYATNDYNTTLGFPPGEAAGTYPELYFNLGIKRAFLGPFFDHVVFAIVAALLLFAILALTTTGEETRQRFGVSTFGVLGSCSGLLFAVVLKHNQIRTVVSPRQITYLETLPFVLYLFILLVSLNAILLASPWHLKLVEYKDNILPVLLYWPLLLSLLLVVTLFTFYW